MLQGFFDEPGHRGKDSHLIEFTHGGCVATVGAWTAFEKDWTAFLNRHSIGWFHATEFSDLAKHRPELEEAAQIIKDNKISCYGSTIFIPKAHQPAEAKKTLQKFYEDSAIDLIWNAARYAEALDDEIDLIFAKAH